MTHAALCDDNGLSVAISKLTDSLLFAVICSLALPLHLLQLPAEGRHGADGRQHLVGHRPRLSVGLELHPREPRHELEGERGRERGGEGREREKGERGIYIQYIYIYIYMGRGRERETGRETDRQGEADRQKEIQGDREREGARERETARGYS